MTSNKQLVFWLIACALILMKMLAPLVPCESEPRIETRFECVNDVILEFAKHGFRCSGNLSSDASCLKMISVNRTRILVNGKVEPITESSQTSKKRDKNLDSHQSRHRAESRSNRPVQSSIDIERGPNLDLLGCEHIQTGFVAYKNQKIRSDDKVSEIHGTLNHPVIGNTACVLKQAKRKDIKAFKRLHVEMKKRQNFGTRTRISNRMLGRCEESNQLQILVELDQMSTTLCDSVDEPVLSYTESRCYRNERLMNLIEKSGDKSRSAFIFIKELLCLFAELESKKYFVKDIHGKHLIVTSNFSVFYRNLDVLSYYGSNNILSGATCQFDEECPRPEGDLWSNKSANQGIYSKCFDTIPYCHNTRCSGYNASLHICGISRWILQPLYKYFTRIRDRSRLTSIIMATINSWPFLRNSALVSCKKMMTYYEMFEKDMKADNKANSKGFHIR